MKIKLVATDLDGTLIPTGRSTPEIVLDTLEEVMEQGIYVVPATGRTLSGIPSEILSLTGLRYVISSNGAVITDVQTGQRVYERLIPPAEAAALLRRLYTYDAYACAYIENQPFNWRTLPGFLRRYYRNIAFFQQNPRYDLAAYIEENALHVEKIFVAVASQEEKVLLRSEMRQFSDLQLTSTSAWNLELTYRDADKGNALAWLGKSLNILPEEILAMGDNENDHTMLRLAGIAVTPSNGTDATREIADMVIPSCDHCGTASYLREHLLKGGK